MYYLYYLVSEKSNGLYVGVTSNIKQRLASHRWCANKGNTRPLYTHMRELGVNNFVIWTVQSYKNKNEAYLAEEVEIRRLRQDTGNNILNVASGGLGGYVVPEEYKEIWRAKLIKARKGRKPALGMKHTEENKRLFAECNKRKIPKYPKDIITLTFKEANEQYNISKTHYYRLLKQAKSNDLS